MVVCSDSDDGCVYANDILHSTFQAEIMFRGIQRIVYCIPVFAEKQAEACDDDRILVFSLMLFLCPSLAWSTLHVGAEVACHRHDPCANQGG